MAETLLFCYGHLKMSYSPPKGALLLDKDEVRGEMWDRPGDDPAMVNIGKPYSPWVSGELLRIDDSILPDLDKTETGYERVQTNTRGRKKAWIYQWKGEVPSRRKLITRWERAGRR